MDAIIVWPRGFDFPIFRKFIHEERKRFHRVIVVYSNNHTKFDLSQKITDAMAKDDVAVMFADRTGNEDWRDLAIKKALSYSNSSWIFFIEQDFSIKPGFWEEFNKAKESSDLITVLDNKRFHPCCFVIKRSLLDKTSLDFSADPDAKWDHFGKIQQDLEKLSIAIKVWFMSPGTYYHMNGLTQNLRLLELGQEIGYKPQEFKEYLKDCLKCGMELNVDEFVRKEGQ